MSRPVYFIFLILAAIPLLLAEAGTYFRCPEDVYNDPDKCRCASECPFSTLESAMMTGENQYQLWVTFHHPREAFPQFLEVNYCVNESTVNCSTDRNSTTTYLWTSNSIYFVIPPRVFGLLSLFLGVLDDDHTGCVNLTIPEECRCWLNERFYEAEGNLATTNHLEVLTEKLRLYGHAKNFPSSISNYQFRSSAVLANKNKITKVYNDGTDIDVFLSFMIILPLLATIAFFVIVLSCRDTIEESMEKPEEHKNYAALICLGVTFAWFATVVDIVALTFHQHNDLKSILYQGQIKWKNDKLCTFLIISIILEVSVIIIFDLFPLGICICARNRINSIVYVPPFLVDEKVDFWTCMLPLVPPLWCLSSRFGFIIVSLTSFIRHGAAFTVFYIFAIAAEFIIMRQTYQLIAHFWYKLRHKLNRKQDIERKMKEDGISIAAIWLVRLVGVVLVLFFAYLIFGLWLLPVSEVVEDAPVYLNDALQLVFIMLAALISYELFSIKDIRQQNRE